MAKYFPVLRWKQGEQQALANINPQFTDYIIPIIEFAKLGQPRPDPNKTTAQLINDQEAAMRRKLAGFSTLLHQIWGNREILLDTYSILDQTQINFNYGDVIQLFANPNRTITPLINLNFVSNQLTSFIENLYASNRIQNIAFRVNLDTGVTSNAYMQNLCQRLGIDLANTTIIFDLGDVSTNRVIQCTRNFNSLYGNFNYNQTRMILLSGGLNIPGTLTSNSRSQFDRIDWLSWLNIHGNTRFANLNFGDYTISSPNFIDTPYPGAPKIRYTFDNEWLVYKGIKSRSPQTRNAIQFRHMAGQIVALNNWSNLNCYGDRRMQTCANDTEQIGSTTTWVGIGTNRHIAVVMSQLSANHFLT